MLTTEQALDQLFAQWITLHCQQNHGFPLVELDPQWPSLCEIDGTVAGDQVQWQPIKRAVGGDFSNVETALDLVLHPDIKSYYAGYWSAELALEHPKGPVFLLQPWNEQDFERLQQNLIGHIMMKKSLKQPITLFFGLTDQDDQMISLVNDSGEIWLESVGKQPHLKLADSMTAFLQQLAEQI